MQIRPTPQAMIALAIIAATMPAAAGIPKPPKCRSEAAEVTMAVV